MPSGAASHFAAQNAHAPRAWPYLVAALSACLPVRPLRAPPVAVAISPAPALDAPAADAIEAAPADAARGAQWPRLPYPWWTVPAPGERASISATPELPMQRAPWRVRRETAFTRAARFYFDNGLPDPRGLAYVRAHVEYAGERRAVSGWRVPAPPGRTGELFLTWTGLLLEPVSIDGPADVRAETASVRSELVAERYDPEYFSRHDPLAPGRYSFVTMMYLARLGLLGDWQPSYFRRAFSHDTLSEAERDAHLRHWVSQPVGFALASESAAFFSQGRFAEALRAARSFRAMCDGHEAANRAVPRVAVPAWHCERVEPIEAEAARRVRGSERPPPDPDSVRDRVRSIIVGLEDARGQTVDDPPGHCIYFSSACDELIALGDAAIDGLIDAYEGDTRSTRIVIVPFGGAHAPPPRMMAVHELARAALAMLLGRSVDELVPEPYGRDSAARAARASVMRERRARGELRAAVPEWHRPSRTRGAP